MPEQCEEVHEEVRGDGEERSGSAVAAAAGESVGGIAARGQTPDRAGGVEDHPGSERGRSDAARRTAPPAGFGVELLALVAERKENKTELKLNDRVNLSKLSNCLGHPTLLVRLQAGIHGQRKNLVRGLLRHGEVTTVPVP